MKTRLGILCLVLAALVFGMIFVGCGTASTNEQNNKAAETTDGTSSVTEMDITELKQGDTVSIVGQVASSRLVNDDTIWVQVKQSDGTFVIYHCQMKQEFIDSAEQLEMLDVAKVTGFFLSLTEFEQENTSPIVTLYDCELVE